MNLTIEQNEIIKHAPSPQTVIARAGSGKTFTIGKANKLHHHPVFVYNKKVAEELVEKGIPAKTSHSYCLGKLKSIGLRSRISIFADTTTFYKQLNSRGITDKKKRAPLLKEMGKIIPILKENLYVPSEDTNLLNLISLMERHGISKISPEEVLSTYEKSIKSLSLSSREISFSDILLLFYWNVERFEKIPHAWVDEAQDLNILQLKIFRGHCATCSFVGDPAQAIYGFRGAGHGSMDRIQELFPENKIQTLSICFRCGENIIYKAQKYIHDILPDPGKDYVGAVVENATAPSILQPHSAILSRTNKELIPILMHELSEGRIVNFKDKKFLSEVLEMKYSIAGNGREETLQNISSLATFDLRKRAKMIFDCAEISNTPLLKKAIKEKREDLPCLSTVHSAKGLEWETVYLLDWEIDSELLDWEISEENNLKYVAITRAIKTLFIIPENN